jgi:dolichol-phosphate mannosyltransferase
MRHNSIGLCRNNPLPVCLMIEETRPTVAAFNSPSFSAIRNLSLPCRTEHGAAQSTLAASQTHLSAHSTARSMEVAVMEVAVVVPTLNELGNIGGIIDGVLQADERLHIIVVDDGSADGTAEFVQRLAQSQETKYLTASGISRVHLLARGRKLGYASAVQDGMRYAMSQGAHLILQMDADFSHDPKYLPRILEKSRYFDLVIGSRYLKGGGTRNWGLDRKILSGGANWLARSVLGLATHDCTGGFRCWKRELIERAGILDVRVEGYAFLFLTLDLCRHVGASIGEVPIVFVDREFGQSKMSRRIIIEAIKVLGGLWWRRILNKR